jgi:hypothetical protein
MASELIPSERVAAGSPNGLPVHVLVARESGTGNCHVVTVYRPDPALWSSDFKTRRQS